MMDRMTVNMVGLAMDNFQGIGDGKENGIVVDWNE